MRNFCRTFQTYLGLSEEKPKHGAESKLMSTNESDVGSSPARDSDIVFRGLAACAATRSMARTSPGDILSQVCTVGGISGRAQAGNAATNHYSVELKCVDPDHRIFGELHDWNGKSSSGLGLAATAELHKLSNVFKTFSVQAEKSIYVVDRAKALEDPDVVLKSGNGSRHKSYGGDDDDHTSERIAEAAAEDDHDDLWGSCQPKKSFDSLIGSLQLSGPSANWEFASSNYRWAKHTDGLRSCTESLGFESSDERDNCWIGSRIRVDEGVIKSTTCADHVSGKEKALESKSEERYLPKRWRAAATVNFPPPLSSIARNGQPCVFHKPFRKDGRFVLQEVKVPRQEFFHAWRQDGRLRLHLLRPRQYLTPRHIINYPVTDQYDQTGDTAATSDFQRRMDSWAGQHGLHNIVAEGDGDPANVHVESFSHCSGRRVPMFQLKNEGCGRWQERRNCMSMWELRCVTT